jgi:hypothetical protein
MAFIGNGAQLTDLDAGDIASGTLPVARGGTGTASPSIVAGSGISVSGTWPNQTIASSGGVSSLNGQTGAITNTDFASIGSYVVAVRSTAISGSSPSGTYNYTNCGGTVAGSELRYDTGGASRTNNNNYPGGGSSLSGTWRAMERNTRVGQYIPGSGYGSPYDQYYWDTSLWVRVS